MRNRYPSWAMRAQADAKAVGYGLRDLEYGSLLSLCFLLVVALISTLFRELITKR